MPEIYGMQVSSSWIASVALPCPVYLPLSDLERPFGVDELACRLRCGDAASSSPCEVSVLVPADFVVERIEVLSSARVVEIYVDDSYGGSDRVCEDACCILWLRFESPIVVSSGCRVLCAGCQVS